jgi:hypothetical protein
MKSNYDKAGKNVRLRYHTSTFLPVFPPSGIDARAADNIADRTFLDLLDATREAGRNVSDSVNASN